MRERRQSSPIGAAAVDHASGADLAVGIDVGTRCGRIAPQVVGARRTRSLSVEQRRESRPPPTERQVRPVGIVMNHVTGRIGRNPVVVAAYFLNPRVCAALGYPGQKAIAVDEQPDDIDPQQSWTRSASAGRCIAPRRVGGPGPTRWPPCRTRGSQSAH